MMFTEHCPVVIAYTKTNLIFIETCEVGNSIILFTYEDTAVAYRD